MQILGGCQLHGLGMRVDVYLTHNFLHMYILEVCELEHDINFEVLQGMVGLRFINEKHGDFCKKFFDAYFSFRDCNFSPSVMSL